MSAAAEALRAGRTEITLANLVIALSQDEQMGPILTKLGAKEAAICAAFEDRANAEQRPDSRPED